MSKKARIHPFFARRVLPLILFSLLLAAGFVYGIAVPGRADGASLPSQLSVRPYLTLLLTDTLPLLILFFGAFTAFSPLFSAVLLPLSGAVCGCRAAWLFVLLGTVQISGSRPSLYFFVLFTLGIWQGILTVFFSVDAAAFSARLRVGCPMGRLLRSSAMTGLLVSFSLSLLLTSILTALSRLTLTRLLPLFS